MNFWVVTVTFNGQERSPLPGLYATPFQAAVEAERNQRSTSVHHRFGVRPATWQEREAGMFAAGVYQPPIWHEEKFWIDHGRRLHDLFVHVSFADPQSIAFTEDERKGEADRQTLMRPGKFLQKFMGAGAEGVIDHGPMKGMLPVVTKQKIAFYAAWHKVGARPISEDELGFTDDPMEMIRLYEEGPDSCMMGKGWRDDDHPVQIYAAGDLSLAYLTRKDDPTPIGRALCWPAKEVFGRVYPTPNTEQDREIYDELMARLKALGWTSVEEDGGVFNGARLKYMTNRWGSIIMPYLDHSYGVREVYRDGKTVWVMDDSETHQENTDGTYYTDEPDYDWTCESCDDSFYDHDTSVSVYTRWHASRQITPTRASGYGRGESTWCERCQENHAFWCEGSEEYYDSNMAESIYANDGCTYVREWFDANGGYECSYDGEFYFRDNDPCTLLMNGDWVNNDNLEAAAFQCFYDGQWWPIDFASEAVPGYAQNADCLDVHPIEWEHVIPHVPEEADEGMAVQAVLPRPINPQIEALAAALAA